MLKPKRSLTVLAISAIASALVLIVSPSSSHAANYRDYCDREARSLSGYNGKAGDVVGGAVKGALGAAIISGILGGDKKDRKKAAGIGAILGGLGAATRKNSRAARIYRLEFEDCMRRR